MTAVKAQVLPKSWPDYFQCLGALTQCRPSSDGRHGRLQQVALARACALSNRMQKVFNPSSVAPQAQVAQALALTVVQCLAVDGGRSFLRCLYLFA